VFQTKKTPLGSFFGLSLLFSLLLAGLCATRLAVAQQPIDRYSAMIPVQAQSSSEERRALRAGLAEVLVKLSGERYAAQNAVVARALTTPREYLASMGFTGAGDQRALKIVFSRAPVDQLLRQAQLPVWPEPRPELLLWVQLDRLPLGRHWLEYSTDADILALIDEVMAERGVRWRLPDFDLVDRLAVADNRALLLDPEILASASGRYTTSLGQHWAALRLVTNTEGSARGSWVQQLGDERLQGELAAATELDQWREWLHSIVDHLAARYAYMPLQQAGLLKLNISGVKDLQSYEAVLAVLAGIEPLVSVQLRELTPNSIALNAQAEGDRLRVLAALLATEKFVQSESSEQQPPESSLHLYWQASDE